jgi:serine/threonine protein kinase
MAIVSSNCSVVPALGGPSSNQPILIPDLTRLITRSYPYYSVSGGAYGDIYKCVYHSGPGAAGDVQVRADAYISYQVFHLLSLHPQVAVKAIRSQVFSDEVFRRELGIWKRLRHPNILTLMGTAQGFCRSVALVAPWIVNGDLTSFLSKNNHTLCLLDRLLLVRNYVAAFHSRAHRFVHKLRGIAAGLMYRK